MTFKLYARCIAAACLLTCNALVPGCSDSTSPCCPRFSAEAPVGFVVTGGSRIALIVDGINGSVQVTGSPSAAVVTITGVRRVESDSIDDANAHLDELSVVVDSTDTDVLVRTEQPTEANGRNYIVNYTITVPVDFAVSVTNVNGETAFTTLTSNVSAHTGNGLISCQDIVGNADLNVANGEIVGNIRILSGGHIVAAVANGEIDLRIPRTTSAEFSARVANGGVYISDLTLSNVTQTATSVSGTLGAGDGTIDLDVANGKIFARGI